MKEGKAEIYAENPPDSLPLNESELQRYQHKYHSSVEELQRVYQAVGNDKIKLENFLELNTQQINTTSHAEELPEIAINPNPGANANIESVVENMSSEDISRQSRLPNSEVTDGEAG